MQGNIGDCYLMATLISLARNDPQAIRNCFLQSDEEIEKARLINVKLYTVTGGINDYIKLTTDKNFSTNVFIYKPSKPYIVTIDRDEIDTKNLSKTKVLWPKVIEAAYAEFRKKYHEMSIVTSGEKAKKRHDEFLKTVKKAIINK